MIDKAMQRIMHNDKLDKEIDAHISKNKPFRRIVRFRNPRKHKMASGQEYIKLTDAGTWESFPVFAKIFSAQIGAKIIEKIDAVDIRMWDIKFNGVIIRLVYDDFPNGLSVEPKGSDG